MKREHIGTRGGLFTVLALKKTLLLVALFLVVIVGSAMTMRAYADDDKTQAEGERLITLYDHGLEQSFMTSASTIGDALKEANIEIDARDRVEPALDQKLVANEYTVNVYRARPLFVIDGMLRQVIMTASQVPDQIAKDANITLYDEDVTAIEQSGDLLTDGAAERFVVKRATPFTLTLYGKTFTARTQAKTVGEMLKEKNVELGNNDRVSAPLDTEIAEGMSLRVWREGKQTITKDEEVKFEVETIQDADQPVGYRQVKTPGVKGSRTVTYEVIIKDGKESSRKEITSVVVKHAVKQVEIIGAKTSSNPLTKAMGVNQFKDSNGVVHRETYYDLPMAVVMGNCGAGGYYEIRSDGAKVDRNGYVIIAANLVNYPRCSVVETSMGLGKVYDTGGFAAVHAHGFDLATDWSNYNGR